MRSANNPWGLRFQRFRDRGMLRLWLLEAPKSRTLCVILIVGRDNIFLLIKLLLCHASQLGERRVQFSQRLENVTAAVRQTPDKFLRVFRFQTPRDQKRR